MCGVYIALVSLQVLRASVTMPRLPESALSFVLAFGALCGLSTTLPLPVALSC